MRSGPRIPPNCDLALGLRCVAKPEPGVTEWEMPADERFANPAGTIQGGVLGALADSAMAGSTVTWAAARGWRVWAANTDLKVSFLRPAAATGVLRCSARVVSGGRRVVFVEAEVIGDDGRPVARASSTYLLSPREASG